jgi:hypothetical protein
MEYMAGLPYSLAEAGPRSVDGVGNCKSEWRGRTNFELLTDALSIAFGIDMIKLYSHDA